MRLLSTTNLPVHWYFFQDWLKVTLGFSYNPYKTNAVCIWFNRFISEIHFAPTCSGLEDSNYPCTFLSLVIRQILWRNKEQGKKQPKSQETVFFFNITSSPARSPSPIHSMVLQQFFLKNIYRHPVFCVLKTINRLTCTGLFIFNSCFILVRVTLNPEHRVQSRNTPRIRQHYITGHQAHTLTHRGKHVFGPCYPANVYMGTIEKGFGN